MATSWPISANTGASAQIEVSIAWGADLMADPTTWVWTEITGDVMDDPGISVTRGRGDEASNSQPATFTATLDNRAGSYSVGGEFANWPYVRQGTPVRMRINHAGAGLVTAFQGTADGFTPVWPFHSVPQVKLSASGTLRRLSQGQAPFQSSMFREVSVDSRAVIYWPCEDGDRAGGFLPAVGPYFMTWDTPPGLAADDSFECSKAIPVLKLSKWTATVPSGGTSDFMVRFLTRFDDDQARAGADGSTVFTLFTTGTAAIWVLRYTHGVGGEGVFTLSIYDGSLGLLYASSSFVSYVNVPGMAAMISVSGHQAGGDVEVSYAQSALLDDSANTFGFTETIVGNTCGNVTGLWINPDKTLDEVSIGHLTVYNDELDFFDGLAAARAYREEYADTRLFRLEDETGESIDVGGISYVTMGPQEPSTLMDLLREIEQADGGILYDGETHGLSYQTREQRENRPADLTINATNGELLPELQPVHDDQRIRNRAYVTRKTAGTFMAEDATGALGTEVVGIYDTSVTASLYDDNAAMDLGGWIVHLGTVEGYRYPTVTVNLGANPDLIADVLALKPGHRIDITNLGTALTSHPGPTTLSLAVEGFAYRLSAMSWEVVFKCSRYDPWNVIELDDDFASPISLVASSDDEAANNASIVVDPPDSYDGDDLIILVASIRNSGTGTVNTPAGWTTILTSGNVSVFGWVEAREFTGTGAIEPTTVTFSGGAAGADCLGQMFAIRGTAAHRLGIAAALHASAAQLNGSAQNCAMPALTVSQDNCAIVALVWKADNFTSASNPYGFTEFPVVVSSTLGDDACMFVAWGIQSTATSYGALTYTISGGAAAISRGIMLAFLPDPTPPPAPQLDTMGSTLEASISAGATSMSVRTTDAGPISYVGIGALAAGNNTFLAPDFPTGLQDGDLLIAVAAIRNSGTGTCDLPGDWTTLSNFGNLHAFAWHYNAAQGDTSVPMFFTGGVANATTLGQVMAFRGCSPNVDTMLQSSATQLNGSAQNIAVPGLVAGHDDVTLIVIGWKQDDWTSVAQLSGQFFTEISDSPSVLGDDAGLEIQYRLGGFTNAKTLTATSLTVTGGAAAISRAMVLALQPNTDFIWTQDAADYPIDLDVGGVKITATACADAYSPQTMTISAAPVARTAGMPVKLWRPAALSRNQGL